MTDTAAPKVSRGLVVALGVVAGLAAAFALYAFVVQPLLGDELADGAEPPLAQPVQATDPFGQDAQPGDEPVEAVEETPAAPLPETFEVFSARDPFQQQRGTPGEPAPEQPATQQPTTQQPTTQRPTTGTTAPSGTRVGATVIRVVEVSTGDDGVERVTVTINGEGYTVTQGETFARSFRVLDITGDCATFLFGDNRFTLCAGEEIRK
jgi:hypothetical protein